GGDRVSAVACGSMDEGSTHPAGDAAVPAIHHQTRAPHDGAPVPRTDLAITLRPRELARRVSTFQANPCTRTHLSGVARPCSIRPECPPDIGHFAETRVRSEGSHFRHADRRSAITPALGVGRWKLGV